MAVECGAFLVPWAGLDLGATMRQLHDVGGSFLSLSAKDSMGRTWSASDVVPRWSGRGDVLERAVSEAHAAGIKVRASVAVFADAYQGQRHPDWVAVGTDGVQAMRPGWTEDWYYHLCPTRPEQRAYIVAFVDELVSRYDVDGIDLDFIRFPWKGANQDGPERWFCFCAVCRDTFTQASGEPWPAEPFLSEQWLQWRGGVITSLVAEIAAVCNAKSRTLAPFIALWTADGFGAEALRRSGEHFGQDHAELGKICTELSPMIYHRFTDEPTCYTLRTVRWIRDVTWHLRELGATVCSVIQGGPPASAIEIYEEVRGAVDAGASAVMSYPGWSWSVDNAYWTALADAYRHIGTVDD